MWPVLSVANTSDKEHSCLEIPVSQCRQGMRHSTPQITGQRQPPCPHYLVKLVKCKNFLGLRGGTAHFCTVLRLKILAWHFPGI